VRLVPALTMVQAVVGGALLARPSAVARAVAGDGRPAPSWVVRLLGARLALQSGFVQWTRARGRHGSAAVRAAAAVDAIHAASMMAVAVRMPSYRRSAVVSGAVAALSAVVAVAGSTRYAGRSRA
jgi:hypothetical protein